MPSTTGASVSTEADRLRWSLQEIENQLRVATTQTAFHEHELARWRNRSLSLMLRRHRLERAPKESVHA